MSTAYYQQWDFDELMSMQGASTEHNDDETDFDGYDEYASSLCVDDCECCNCMECLGLSWANFI